MERKIGEIFEYNGEWYQCVEGNCAYCSIQYEACEQRILNDVCKLNRIFKKLEKVGEPYINNDRTYQLYKLPMNIEKLSQQNDGINLVRFDTVEIEIKQTKEDMEEKKLNLKPFDIQKAREGKPVCTRDGRKARIICFDRKLFYRKVSYPILALVERSDGEDDVCGYNEKGKVLIEDGAEYKDDLMILPEKKEGWINICRNLNTNKTELDTKDIYNTKEEALQNLSSMTYVTTVKIEWEE